MLPIKEHRHPEVPVVACMPCSERFVIEIDQMNCLNRIQIWRINQIKNQSSFRLQRCPFRLIHTAESSACSIILRLTAPCMQAHLLVLHGALKLWQEKAECTSYLQLWLSRSTMWISEQPLHYSCTWEHSLISAQIPQESHKKFTLVEVL